MVRALVVVLLAMTVLPGAHSERASTSSDLVCDLRELGYPRGGFPGWGHEHTHLAPNGYTVFSFTVPNAGYWGYSITLGTRADSTATMHRETTERAFAHMFVLQNGTIVAQGARYAGAQGGLVVHADQAHHYRAPYAQKALCEVSSTLYSMPLSMGEYRAVVIHAADQRSTGMFGLPVSLAPASLATGGGVLVTEETLDCAQRERVVVAGLVHARLAGCALALPRAAEEGSDRYWSINLGHEPDDRHRVEWVSAAGETPLSFHAGQGWWTSHGRDRRDADLGVPLYDTPAATTRPAPGGVPVEKGIFGVMAAIPAAQHGT